MKSPEYVKKFFGVAQVENRMYNLISKDDESAATVGKRKRAEAHKDEMRCLNVSVNV